MASKLAWFTTENGRKFVQGGIFAAGLAAMGTGFAVHTVFLNKYQEIVQMYRSGKEVPVSPKIKNLVDEVIQDMGISEFEKFYLKMFTVYGFDVFHAGSTLLKTGAIIGLPINFTYESEKDVDRNIKVVNKGINWESDTGAALKSALVLSNDAKKFAIAREISHTQTYYAHFLPLYPGVGLYITALLARNVNEKLRLLQRPLVLRGVLYCISSLLGFTIYCFSTDFTSVSYDHYADDKASSLGTAYIKGGIEYYSKLLERNKALRAVLGTDGEKLYSIHGNENLFLRQKTLPLVHRKLFLEDKLKHLKEGGEALKAEDYIFGSKFSEEAQA